MPVNERERLITALTDAMRASEQSLRLARQMQHDLQVLLHFQAIAQNSLERVSISTALLPPWTDGGAQ